MTKNINKIERIIRLTLGITILLLISQYDLQNWLIAALSFVSFTMFASSISGFCPLYSRLDKVEKLIGKSKRESNDYR